MRQLLRGDAGTSADIQRQQRAIALRFDRRDITRQFIEEGLRVARPKLPIAAGNLVKGFKSFLIHFLGLA